MVERATATIPATSAAEVDEELDAELVEDELLIEEISIDGMCGVY